MNYHHLTIEERACLRKFYNEGLSFRKIAKLLSRSPSTIYREIVGNYTHRYEYNTYYPQTAQKKYLFRRSFCHRGMFWNKEVTDYITEKLSLTWSPEQISNTPCGFKLPSYKTIYHWIYEGYLVKRNLKVLRRKERRESDWGRADDLQRERVSENEIKACLNE